MLKYKDLREWAIENKAIISANQSAQYSNDLKTTYEIVSSKSESTSGDLNLIEKRPGLAKMENTICYQSNFLIAKQKHILYPGIPSDGIKGGEALAKQSRKLKELTIEVSKHTIKNGIISRFQSKFFGHIIVHTAGVINALIDCPDKNPSVYLLSTNPKALPLNFLGEIFHEAGIQTSQIRFLTGENIRLKQSWCPVFPVSYGQNTHHTSRLFFSRFRKELGIPENLPANTIKRQRVYISRGDASYRRVINESEIVTALKKYSFKVIEASKLSFYELRDILGNAEIIISTIGSNMFNCVFAPSHAQVGEFVPITEYEWDQSNMNCVSTVIAGCGQDYWRINCDAVKEEGVKYSRIKGVGVKYSDQDIHVPVENVTACVDKMLENLK